MPKENFSKCVRIPLFNVINDDLFITFLYDGEEPFLILILYFVSVRLFCPKLFNFSRRVIEWQTMKLIIGVIDL